ncbi:hypothetical protein MNEG_5785 [Monoraphidium neglectum]|uniref:Uncharacterized protein n=1 Tax=Monoraphidium neglectum TaxID=145388 RepID=A0A0D2JTG6_9CHLO|nr:hypothetical protein MNEG_5785 [Monoraphidium neglectum]KIZ02173.1 hypothetical protein MNEG_5785 [Monoraphidium neglectum]|eukprot:XP_013901192.1 hypothetical protein MNEG_5785 [Monoraphidium neglectum]
MDQVCSELLAPANATTDSKDPKKLHYGCGVATTAQVNKVSSDLAALEPKVVAAVAQASSAQSALGQGSNQTAALRAQVAALNATLVALTAMTEGLMTNMASAADTGVITQQLEALAAADTRAAQRLASLAAANQTLGQDIARLKASQNQCTCGPELSAVNTTLEAIKSVQAADAAATALVNTTAESFKLAVADGAATISAINSSIIGLTAAIGNVSAIDLSIYAKIVDLATLDAATLGGVPAAQYLRARVPFDV